MIGIVAANHDRIRDLINQLGMDHRKVVAIPARTVDTAARGRVLDALLVDHTATHIDLSDVLPCLLASSGPVYVLTPTQGGVPIGVPHGAPRGLGTAPSSFPPKKRLLDRSERAAQIRRAVCRLWPAGADLSGQCAGRSPALRGVREGRYRAVGARHPDGLPPARGLYVRRVPHVGRE